MAESTLTPPGGEPSVFLRRATGLVRELKTRDVFIIDLLQGNPLGNFAAVLPFIVLFTGADLGLSMVTGVIAGISLVVIYAMLSQAMPRSGGDYLFISRILHPSLGFVGSWTMMLILAFYCGYNGFAICNFLLPDVLAPLGVATHSSWMVSLASALPQPWVESVAVILTAGLYFALGYLGVRTVMRVMWVPIIFTAASLLIGVPYIVLTPHDSFISAFNSFASNFHTSAAGMEAIAAKNGTVLDPPFSWGATIAFWPWVLFVIGYTITSSALGGEIRNVKRAQYIGIIGSSVVGAGIVALFFFLGEWKIGRPLLTATGYLTYVNPAANPLPFPLYPHVLIGSTNLLLLLILSGAVLTNIYFSGPLLQMWGTRYIFAWAMDRMAPAQTAALAGTRNAPVVALAIMAFFSALFGLMLIFVPNFSLVATGLLQNVILLLVSLAAVIFPWRKPDLYRASVNWEVAGVPVISILGVVAIAFNLVMVYFFITNSAFGTVTNVALIFAGTLVLTGIAYYVVAWAMARRRGVDLGLAFSEIPPE